MRTLLSLEPMKTRDESVTDLSGAAGFLDSTTFLLTFGPLDSAIHPASRLVCWLAPQPVWSPGLGGRIPRRSDLTGVGASPPAQVTGQGGREMAFPGGDTAQLIKIQDSALESRPAASLEPTTIFPCLRKDNPNFWVT